LTLLINIVGVGRGSGKTTLVEAIVQKLSERFKIWTIKHIASSFDTADKDTWKHLHAGAETVMAVTGNEIVTIKKKANLSLEEVISGVPDRVDLVLVEGFKNSTFPKIVVAKNVNDARKVLDITTHVFAIYLGENSSDLELIGKIPILKMADLMSEVEKMVFIDIVKKLPGFNCKNCGFPTCEALAQAILDGKITLEKCTILSDTTLGLIVNGKKIFLSSFPKDFVKNTVLGMLRSLKGVDERVNSVNLEINL
jgi:molybdopterin-guanine dinucleotide biosynthesis protein B